MADDVPESVRIECYARDAHRCRVCGITNGMYNLHHILYRSQGGPHTKENLITLCRRCHDLVHSNKSFWQPLLQELVGFDKPVTGFQYIRWQKAAGIKRADL